MSNTAPVEDMTLEELRVCVTQLRTELMASRTVAAHLAEQQLIFPPLSEDGMAEIQELIQRDRMRTMTPMTLPEYTGAVNELYEVDLDPTDPPVFADAAWEDMGPQPGYIILELPL